MQLSEDIQIRIKKRTHRELIKISGQLTTRDGYFTTLDLTIAELVKFWNSEKSLQPKEE